MEDCGRKTEKGGRNERTNAGKSEGMRCETAKIKLNNIFYYTSIYK